MKLFIASLFPNSTAWVSDFKMPPRCAFSEAEPKYTMDIRPETLEYKLSTDKKHSKNSNRFVVSVSAFCLCFPKKTAAQILHVGTLKKPYDGGTPFPRLRFFNATRLRPTVSPQLHTAWCNLAQCPAHLSCQQWLDHCFRHQIGLGA